MIARAHEPRRLGLLIESDGPGGAEQVVSQLAEHFTGTGHEVVVMVPADGEGWIRRRLRGTSAQVEELPLGGPLSPHGIAALTAALRRRGVQLLHTHEFGQALAGACAARLAGIPHVITMHGGQYFAERKRRRAALKLAIAMSRGVTAVSAPLAVRLTETLHLGPTQVEILPNGARVVAEGNGHPAALNGIPAGAEVVLALGNLYPVKGHCHLVRAVATLAERHPRLHLALAGRGDEEPTLRALAQKEGITDRVHFLGFRDDVGPLLGAARLFAQPSLAEGLPLAVLEAMHAGLPIVASAVGELPRVLADGEAGLLVPPADPSALAQAMERLLADPAAATALGGRARQRANAEYGLDRMMQRYHALYERALNGARPA